MAKEDARLREQGMPITKIIDALAAATPNRTREAVKSHRHGSAYVDLVKTYMVASDNGGGDDPGPPTNGGEVEALAIGPPSQDTDGGDNDGPPINGREAEALSISPPSRDTTPVTVAVPTQPPSPVRQDTGMAGPGLPTGETQGDPRVRADNWQGPVREAIIEYSSVACLCPEILQHIILGNSIDRGYMQTLIDRDLQSRNVVIRPDIAISLQGRPETHVLPDGQTRQKFSPCTAKTGLNVLGSSFLVNGPEYSRASPSGNKSVSGNR